MLDGPFHTNTDPSNSTESACANELVREQCEERGCIYSIHIDSGCGQCVCDQAAGDGKRRPACPTPMCARGCELVHPPNQCPTCKCGRHPQRLGGAAGPAAKPIERREDSPADGAEPVASNHTEEIDEK